MWVQLVYLNIIRFFSGYAHIATFNLKKQTYAGHTAVLFDTTDLHQVQNVRTGTQADKHLSNTNTASVFEHFSLYDLPVELQMQYKQKVLFSEIFHFSPVFISSMSKGFPTQESKSYQVHFSSTMLIGSGWST